MKRIWWHVCYRLGRYEGVIRPNLRAMLNEMSPGDIVLDFGANIGFFTWLFHYHGAKVHAFEPGAAAYSALERNVGGLRGVKIYKSAVGASDGRGQLFLHVDGIDGTERSESSSMIMGKLNTSAEAFEEVEVRSVKSIVSLFDKIKAIKIDIEGAELDVLPILLDPVCSKKIEYIFCEMHDSQFPEREADFRALRHNVSLAKTSKIDLDWH